MISLKELNKKIAQNIEKENLGLIKELHEQLLDFEKHIVQAAEAGTRTGTYRFVFNKNWQAHDVYNLVEKELTGLYKPMVFNVLTVDFVTKKLKPFVGVEFIIPGIDPNHSATDYGYRMDERTKEL